MWERVDLFRAQIAKSVAARAIYLGVMSSNPPIGQHSFRRLTTVTVTGDIRHPPCYDLKLLKTTFNHN